MHAIAQTRPLPITDPEALVDLDLPTPTPTGRDLLVAVRAIAVNPVDYKVRLSPLDADAAPRVLGWDVAGVVQAVGPDVTLFTPGDEVFYAGSIARPGANSALHVVDERIVGHKPGSLEFADAAALPLTAITAWEALFERMDVAPTNAEAQGSILIIGGAGGVGSIAIQLAKRVAGLEVVATASRDETSAWCRELGADHVINHREPLAPQLAALDLPQVDRVLCLNDTSGHWQAMAEVVAPQGTICSIVEPDEPVDLDLLKAKSARFAWEFMFTRSMFETPDMIEQHRLLDEIARLIDAGTLRTTTSRVLRPINAKHLRDAHAQLEEGHTIGKIVLEGWE